MLSVTRFQALEACLQKPGVRYQHAGVDLADQPLLGAGIALLDDAQQPPARVAHHAAIAAGIGELRGQQRKAALARVRQQSAQRVGEQQRHIAIKYQHLVRVGNLRHRLLQGIAGAKLFGLQRPLQPAILEQFAHALAAVSVDHVNRRRRKACCHVQYMREHRRAGQRLQHLRDIRLHPLALAGRQDHDRQGRGAGLAFRRGLWCDRWCEFWRGFCLLARHIV